LGQLREQPGLRRRLVAVLGASAALGEHLVHHPADCRALADDAVGDGPPTGYALLDAVGAVDGRATVDQPTALDALRRGYRRALLLLAARDLTGAAPFDEVTAVLADLAGEALDAALAIARAAQHPSAPPVTLAIIGMGKCGARELNYVSDVDVVFVAEPVERGGDEGAALRAAAKLAEGVIRACGTATAEGTLFPVDAGLRPEGRNGPLVRTLASHEAYYRRWARTWEYQALLKARPVAGDRRLGDAYCAAVAPLVWAAASRPGFVGDVQAMRRRVEHSLPPLSVDRQLKLGPGGLRDVEFAVQLLQLVHGRTDESLRRPATLPALDALAAGGYVGRADAAGLAGSYRFLRMVEHRLQLQRMRRTHVLPRDQTGLRWLARAVGLRTVEEFEGERGRHARDVRRLHEKLFYRPLLVAVARLPAEDARLSPEAARARLSALGFADTAAALRHIEALTTGISRNAAIQRTLLPAMLGWFADAADPNAGLLAYRQVSDALRRTPWYLRLLRDEGSAAERLARLLATSGYLAGLMQRAPESVQMLRSDDELRPRSRDQVAQALLAVVRRNDEWEAAVAAARGVRRMELVRVACADLLGLLDVRGVGRALSDAATATVAAALEVAQRKVETEQRAPLPMTLAVVAMGRLGGGEMGYGSDADVLFVHQPHDGVPDGVAAAAAHAVAEEVRRLLELPAPDPPLRVDAGLRPEGRQGPLTRSLASYEAYYRRWSLHWEAQALLRAAPLAGDPDLGERFIALADDVRYPAVLPREAVEEMARLKQRMERERIPRGVDR
ncbi:MAG TPA: bifunctional [glutamine synthetase] adenylyltransferase/[glutamine synthetase]-adenylyl-L-tyrosine phosphorylase, partial [Frankiaceae bacterium]|nr:bifunctional [glutamine synthetase] adenylyltransferase/[glutamine synthetase]-adenylyl-L-tyrosine phosphorylase [Frankiaceae bacterium]